MELVMLIIMGVVFCVFGIKTFKNRKNIIEQDLSLEEKVKGKQYTLGYKMSRSNPYGMVFVGILMTFFGALLILFSLIMIVK